MTIDMEYTDHLNRKVHLNGTPERIICLVPSITELLVDLGLEQKIVGRTKFCIFPERIKSTIPEVGGTKQIRIKEIKALNPDLIIANKEENTKELVEELTKFVPVFVTNVQSVHGGLAMIEDIARLTNAVNSGTLLINAIHQEQLKCSKEEFPHRKILYLIWQNPYMTIGVDTFIYDMMKSINCESVIYDFRYPEIKESFLKKCDAEYIFLSSEPFPFKEKHVIEMKEKFPDKQIVLVDGSYFSWYGSRMMKAFKYFQKLNNKLLTI